MRILGGLLLAVGLASCYGHDRPVGEKETPLSVKASGTEQSQATRDRERMDVQGPHADAPDSSEMGKNGAVCKTDSDCTGRLRCVSYTGTAGRETKQCLFPCGDGCPSGWNCQIVSDGPTNTCARAR